MVFFRFGPHGQEPRAKEPAGAPSMGKEVGIASKPRLARILRMREPSSGAAPLDLVVMTGPDRREPPFVSGCRRNEMHPFLPSIAVSSPILGILGIVGTLSRVPKFAEYVPSMRPDDGISPGFAFLRISATDRCKFTVGRINQSVLRSLGPGYISIRRSP